VGLKKYIATWAKAKGTRKSESLQYGSKAGSPLAYPIAHGLVLSKVAVALGLDQARFLISSAAPISVEVMNNDQRLHAMI